MSGFRVALPNPDTVDSSMAKNGFYSFPARCVALEVCTQALVLFWERTGVRPWRCVSGRAVQDAMPLRQGDAQAQADHARRH